MKRKNAPTGPQASVSCGALSSRAPPALGPVKTSEGLLLLKVYSNFSIVEKSEIASARQNVKIKMSNKSPEIFGKINSQLKIIFTMKIPTHKVELLKLMCF